MSEVEAAAAPAQLKSDGEEVFVKVVDEKGKEQEIKKEVAEVSIFLNTAMKADDYDASKPIELPKSIEVEGNLVEAIEFMTEFARDPMKKIKMPLPSTDMHDNVQKWYADFATSKKREELYALMTVAQDLQIAALMTLCSATVAAVMMQMPKEDLYKMFASMGLQLPAAGATPLQNVTSLNKGIRLSTVDTNIAED